MAAAGEQIRYLSFNLEREEVLLVDQAKSVSGPAYPQAGRAPPRRARPAAPSQLPPEQTNRRRQLVGRRWLGEVAVRGQWDGMGSRAVGGQGEDHGEAPAGGFFGSQTAMHGFGQSAG